MNLRKPEVGQMVVDIPSGGVGGGHCDGPFWFNMRPCYVYVCMLTCVATLSIYTFVICLRVCTNQE